MPEVSETPDDWVARVLGISASVSHRPPSQADADDTIAPGLVAYRRALLEFGQSKSLIASRLETLRKAIPASLPEEADLAEEIAAELGSVNDELGDAIDEAINAARDSRAPYTETIRKHIDYYISFLQTDELVQHVDRNTFVPVDMAATLTSALSKIRQLMV